MYAPGPRHVTSAGTVRSTRFHWWLALASWPVIVVTSSETSNGTTEASNPSLPKVISSPAPRRRMASTSQRSTTGDARGPRPWDMVAAARGAVARVVAVRAHVAAQVGTLALR